MTEYDIQVDALLKRLTIPHLGITMRVLMGFAEAHSEVGTRPTWKIVYKNTTIGEIRLATIRNRDGNT